MPDPMPAADDAAPATRTTSEPVSLDECMADLLAHLREREGRS